MPPGLIYKLVSSLEWREAEVRGTFGGSSVDQRDGFIHFSTAAQVRETAARHFHGMNGLLIVAVRVEGLPLRWEPSRAGALFPHLYQELPMTAVHWARPLELGPDSQHRFPDLE